MRVVAVLQDSPNVQLTAGSVISVGAMMMQSAHLAKILSA
jgi:hypothetical protein